MGRLCNYTPRAPSVPSAYYCPHYCHFWEGSEAASLALLHYRPHSGECHGSILFPLLWGVMVATHTIWDYQLREKSPLSSLTDWLTDWHFVCSRTGMLRTGEVEEEWKIILIYCVTDSKVQAGWHIMCDFNTNDYGTQYFLSFYAEELWLRLSWCYPLPNSPDSALFLRSCTLFVWTGFFQGRRVFVCFLLSQNFFFCPPFSFHQCLSYAKSVFYAQLKLWNTHHSTYFIFLFVVSAAPALHSYLCVVS